MTRKSLFLLLISLFCCGRVRAEQAVPRTAILGALQEEVEILRSEIKDLQEDRWHDLTFYVGTLRGRHVVLTRSGVGKVNAAVVTTLLADHYAPTELIFTGVAGSLRSDLLPGDIIIADRTVQHDFGIFTSSGLVVKPTKRIASVERNPLFFPSDPALVALALAAAKTVDLERLPLGKSLRAPVTTTGTIASGDFFVTSSDKKDWLRKTLGADAVEMEGAAVAQVCLHFSIPLLVIRSLSDNADESAKTDIEKFKKLAALNASRLTVKILEALQETSASRSKVKLQIHPSD